ncbi:MAG: hypothetical protein ACI9F9_002140, partial [Candidatus Paceibacteria bacterium]
VCGFVRIRIEFLETPPDADNADDVYMLIVKLKNEMSPGQPWMAARNASVSFDGRQSSTPLAGGALTQDEAWVQLIGQLYSIAPPLYGEDYPDTWLESRVYAPAHVR